MIIQDKVIVVTGAARGIGLAVASALADKGARLALLDLDSRAFPEVAALFADKNVKAKLYCCDVADESAVEKTFADIRTDFGAIHGLVNNAGVLRDGLLVKFKEGRLVSKMSAADFDLVSNVHMRGAFLCAREAAVHMIESGVDEGCIVSLSSSSFRGNFGQTNYSAAKAGIVAMTRVWAKELGRYNIRATAVAPGMIETDMLRSMPKEQLEAAASTIPVRRIGHTDNIAQAIIAIFENSYQSGGVVDISGGSYL